MTTLTKNDKVHDRLPPKPEPRNVPDIYNGFQDDAAALLRNAMSETGVTYKELTERLNADGIKITAGGLQNKVGRGTFSASFLIHCMRLLDRPIT